ncbi:tyrosine-type recombinase/integrase [Streptomyces sp. NPDC102274]|uniref:tyrosine-type recombinase/integrase n=1 Tax=Streptomyces sp. NPDC102274 TaxID=3366151 RepID=UPI0037F22045
MTATTLTPRTLKAASTAAALKLPRDRFPSRPASSDWPATELGRVDVWERTTATPFVLANPVVQGKRVRGLAHLLDWLHDAPGESWQQRWLASGAEALGAQWRRAPLEWLRERGRCSQWLPSELSNGMKALICADVIRPSLEWLVSVPSLKSDLAPGLALVRDPHGYARLRVHCDNRTDLSASSRRLILQRTSVILATKGGLVDDIALGDVLELAETETAVLTSWPKDLPVFYRTLRDLDILGPQAPTGWRELRTGGQRTPEELIDRYEIESRPVRDLLVDYLRERQPGLDYNSLRDLAYFLGCRFWKDLELHHPGLDSLHLPAEAATAWRQRLLTRPETVTDQDGEKAVVPVARISFRECLIKVRALYLDLSQWAIEDPGRWAHWVAPCPVSQQDIETRKYKRQHKSRMDARTRERLPVLPVLVRTVDQRRRTAETLLHAARQAGPGTAFTAGDQTLVRSVLRTGTSVTTVWADDPNSGKRRDLRQEEEYAFWAWATVEVLRLTGVRIEELLELSHHSLVRYRLATTGEIVPLLQIAPSKTDVERLLVVSPELAEVLSTIISRIREPSGPVPLIPAYDWHECVWMPPAPLLFQRRFRTENRAINHGTIRKMLQAALAGTGLVDPGDGRPLNYTPHDFRRMFITDAIMNGLPPHIAQVIVGHQDINVTLGYKAVYPDEAIRAHLAFLARRRSRRPTEEYRAPTDEEWEDFLGHFERRKVSTGLCGRAYSTPCIHEACLRCSMHWPDPAQRSRIVEIRDNLVARIAEAEREGWLGEVEGLQISLAGASDKLAQIDRHSTTTPVDLGIPSPRSQESSPNQDR